MNAVTLVLCTVPEPEARSLADQLLSEKLAACINLIGPVTSRYWWNGRIDESSEMLLVIKTAGPVARRLRERIVELHSYEVPEVLEFHADEGLPAYLAWVSAACTQ